MQRDLSERERERENAGVGGLRKQYRLISERELFVHPRREGWKGKESERG